MELHKHPIILTVAVAGLAVNAGRQTWLKFTIILLLVIAGEFTYRWINRNLAPDED